jgi:hypothetical protein
VCAENSGGAAVDATRTAASMWETWELLEISGLLQINDGSRVHLRSYDDVHFLCAENGGGGVVDATRTWAQEWETFTLVYAPGQNGPVDTGTQFHLRTYDNVHYVSAEQGGGGQVDATRTWAQQWETFTAINKAGLFPLRDDSGNVEINNDSGQWMQTAAQLSQNGLLTATTHTWTTNSFYGFTGGVAVLACDGADNVLAVTPLHTFGVDGTWIITGNSSRTDLWSEQMNGINDAAYIRIATFYAPHNRLLGDLTTVVQIGGKIVDIAKEIAQIYGSVSTL